MYAGHAYRAQTRTRHSEQPLAIAQHAPLTFDINAEMNVADAVQVPF